MVGRLLDELQEQLVDVQNAEFGDQILKLNVGEERVIVTCKYKNCLMKLTF